MRLMRIAVLVAVLPFAAAAVPNELVQLSMRGQALYAYDHAAKLATAALQKANAFPPGTQIVGRVENALWVFDAGQLSADQATFAASNRVSQTAKGRDSYTVTAAPSDASEIQQDLDETRAIAVARADFGKTTRPYDAAVVQLDNGNMLVYLYPAQTDPKVHPFGGDVRYAMPADGRTILDKHQMHATIVEKPVLRGDEIPPEIAAMLNQFLQMAGFSIPADANSSLPQTQDIATIEDSDVFDVMVTHAPRTYSSGFAHYVIELNGTIASSS